MFRRYAPWLALAAAAGVLVVTRSDGRRQCGRPPGQDRAGSATGQAETIKVERAVHRGVILQGGRPGREGGGTVGPAQVVVRAAVVKRAVEHGAPVTPATDWSSSTRKARLRHPRRPAGAGTGRDRDPPG